MSAELAARAAEHAAYEPIGPDELARRWGVNRSWVNEHIRARCADPIPHAKLGKNPRFSWGSPRLEAWWQRRVAESTSARPRDTSKQRVGSEPQRKEEVA